MNNPLRILFLCTGNSCRSQMAEGWANYLFPGMIEAHSAGIETHGLNERAVRVMAEAGVDISAHRSKHVDELADRHFDYVFTVCDHAHESCPLFPGGTKIIHAGFPDPPRLAKEVAQQGGDEQAQVACYRLVRDQIKAYIKRLPSILEAR